MIGKEPLPAEEFVKELTKAMRELQPTETADNSSSITSDPRLKRRLFPAKTNIKDQPKSTATNRTVNFQSQIPPRTLTKRSGRAVNAPLRLRFRFSATIFRGYSGK